jgi:hypothetical protein
MKAFPNHRSEGMDLRDYFAAQAMQIFMQEKKYGEFDNHPDHNGSYIKFEEGGVPMWEPPEIAEFSYEMADAMMEAREGK